MAQERLRGPVDRGERRAKLVGGRGDEVGFELLEVMHLGQVAERVDGSAVEVHARDRDPALLSVGLERDHDLCLAGIGRARDRNRVDRVPPARNRIESRVAEDLGRRQRRDRLSGRVPEPHDAAPVDEQDPVGDVGDDPRRVRPFLDRAVEPPAIDRERDPAGEILGEREVVRAVRLAGLRARERERSQRSLLRLERDADRRARVDPAENRAVLLAVRGLAQSGDDLEAARLDDLAHGFFGRLIRRDGGFPAQQLGPRDGDSLERASVLDHVDDAPIGIVANGELGHPLDSASIVGRRPEHLARLAHEVEAPLALHRPGRRLAFGRQQPLALLVGPLALADVDEQRLRVERLPLGPANGRDLLAHPDDPAPAREQPIFTLPGRGAARLALPAGEDVVLVVGVQELGEELRVLLPLGRGVPEQPFDLGARVRDRAPVVRRRDQRHHREGLDEGAVPALRLVHPLGCVGDDGAGGDDLAVIAHRGERHRDDELLPVAPSLAQVAPVDALALRHALEAGEHMGRILLRAEQGDPERLSNGPGDFLLNREDIFEFVVERSVPHLNAIRCVNQFRHNSHLFKL